MKFNTSFYTLVAVCSVLLFPISSVALGPSLCRDQTDALEACAEDSIRSPDISDILASCSEEQSSLQECLGSATPEEGETNPPSDGLSTCYLYVAIYDACVAVTNTTASAACPLSCIIDGPDQNCEDYVFVYCERQTCCTECNAYMNEYDSCVANAGSCSVSDPACTGSGSFMATLSTFAAVVCMIGTLLAVH
ncbi:hypothetical protein IV203_006907 [Nitzschia inconspicua]|uniref:Uncharacterized protein n=1 Tax=Nitzschia inconspicua TaxID=303405 RepID=A0A9K3PCC5_9STRA|nr:hypothetical protein IV203_006907 [Nitzschia inconspicua]